MSWWPLFSLIAGLTYCISLEINRHYKIDGMELNGLRSALSTALLLPLIFFMEIPHDFAFYAMLIIGALISSIGMTIQYNVSAKENGRAATLFGPVTIILTFLFWLAIDAQQFNHLRENPIKALIISVVLLISAFSTFFIKKNPLSWSLFLMILPVGVLYSIERVISKLVLDSGDSTFGISLYFVMLSNLMMAIFSFGYIKISKKYEHTVQSILRDPVKLRASFYTAISHTVSWLSICIAIISTPNPAYPSVVTSISPLFFYLYYRHIGYKDRASPISGAILIITSAILIWVTR